MTQKMALLIQKRGYFIPILCFFAEIGLIGLNGPIFFQHTFIQVSVRQQIFLEGQIANFNQQG